MLSIDKNFIIPKPLMDEHILSWCGRIYRINNVRRYIQPTSSYSAFFPFAVSNIAELAAIAGADAETLLRRYTLIPFVRAFVEDKTTFGENGKRNVGTERTPKLAARWGSLRYCPMCANRDVQKRGFAYWRRMHQLPGVLWCNWHKNSLVAVEDDATFVDEPGAHLRGEIAAIGFPRELSDVAPAIRAYMQLAIRILRHPEPVGSTSVAIRLNALAFSFQRSGLNRKNFAAKLRAEVEQAYPIEWLKRTSPQRIGAQRGEAPSEWLKLLYVWPKPRATERYLILAVALSSNLQLIEKILFAPEFAYWNKNAERVLQNSRGMHFVLAAAKKLAISHQIIEVKTTENPELIKAYRSFILGASILEACIANRIDEYELQDYFRERLVLTELECEKK